MRFALLLCLLVPFAARAQVPPILQALRMHDWTVAAGLASAEPDPLAGTLVTFIRLLNAGAAGPGEVQAFMDAHPDWPDRPALEQRYAQALGDEPDAREVGRLCALHRPAPAGLARCAAAWAQLGQSAQAGEAARQAWVSAVNDAGEEAAFLARWGPTITLADQRRRFERLESSDAAAATRQLARLEPAFRGLAAARLALRKGGPDALAGLADVPAELRSDPALLLAEARALRRSGGEAAALALWRSTLPPAEAATPLERRALFWAERDALARDLLGSGDAQSAYALASDEVLPAEQRLDAAFLAGWIALRRLHQPAQAKMHFALLAEGAHSAITQARAAYWLAQVAEDAASKQQALSRAASWPTTYYGQLASRAKGESEAAIEARIAALRDPPVSAAQQHALAGSEMGRAAAILVAWADPMRAGDFLRQMLHPGGTPAELAAVAQFAQRLGEPNVAVQAARLAGREGSVLALSGWPAPVQPPGPLPEALTLGLMRQESSFDPRIVSAAGAHGLMQLLPGTAAQMARAQHVAAEPLADPALNMQLGTAYLASLLAQFDGTEAFAIAAYNAGPRRVRAWVDANDGAAAVHDPEAMVDWIELIPFAETRNYVQRVLENETIYRARGQGAG